jgi:energy-coupling factor transporter ATP-binding protein EcfA2
MGLDFGKIFLYDNQLQEDKMSKSYAELTATQEQTAQQLLRILSENLGHKIVILLLGISGVGKTLLLNLLGGRITELGGSVITPLDLLYHESKDPSNPVKKARGPLVCAVTRDEQERILERFPKHLSKWRSIELVLKSMSESEIVDYISPKMSQRMQLSLKQLASYSLGIPLLADDLLALNLTPEHAFRLAANHFFFNTGRTSDLNEACGWFNKFLNVLPPAEFLEDFPRKVNSVSLYSSDRIYDSIWYFQAIKRDQQQHQRKNEEIVPDPDPLFVAPESEAIYDGMLSDRSSVSQMHLYVPSMKPEQQVVILKMLGFRFEHGSFDDTRQSKLSLFGGSYRKVSFYFRDNFGMKAVLENECDFTESLANLYHSKVARGNYQPLKVSRSGCQMLVEAHDHDGLRTNPIRIGWGLEAILQQQGVSYLVNNPMCNKLYAFDARTKHIVDLGEAKDIPVWKLPRSKSRQ